jgi:hypothetical protein
MPRPWTGNKPFYVRLTTAEIELLKREKARQNLPSLSAVMEKAVCDLLAQSDPGRDGLQVPAAQGRLHNRVYLLSPNTIGVLNDLASTRGKTPGTLMSLICHDESV